MTIETALKRLLRYAKVFGSEAVLEQLKTFADQTICQYFARELLEVSKQLEKVRQQLKLADECCDDVLSRRDFVQTVMNWQGTDTSWTTIKYLTPPTSINDAEAARLQLVEMNTLVDDHMIIYATSVTNIRDWTEGARANAHNAEGKRYQSAAENKKRVMPNKFKATSATPAGIIRKPASDFSLSIAPIPIGTKKWSDFACVISKRN
jgi:hypothetical protein